MLTRVSSKPELALPVVHVVDDDGDLRQSLAFLLESVRIRTLLHPSARSFLDALHPDEPGIVILDVRMPGLSGFQVQEELARIGYPAPVIFCSAHGDIPMSVRALRAGAVDFLEKPYEPQRMLEIIQAQLPVAQRAFEAHWRRVEVARQVEALTARERDVLRLVIEGHQSQRIAQELGTSVKTIDVHRAHIKNKTGADSIAAFVRDVLQHRVPV
jgi:FixJ family two-component response regulator